MFTGSRPVAGLPAAKNGRNWGILTVAARKNFPTYGRLAL
jgi:hypothetical protein